MKHTKGKWSKSNPSIGNKRLFTIHSDKLLIAKTCDHLDRFNNSLITPEEAEANAKLIAEAPKTMDRLIYTTDYLKLLAKNKLIPEGTRATIKELIFWNEKTIHNATK